MLFRRSSSIFFKSQVFKYVVRNTIVVSNGLDLDQACRFVGPDLGPNCLQTIISRRQRHANRYCKTSRCFIEEKFRQK